jgi:hypothetical protein
MTYIYYIDGTKHLVEIRNKKIPWKEISSPDEYTPALEDLSDGYKFYCEINEQIHRLTGPAEIYPNKRLLYGLNGRVFNNVNDWLKHHPNPELYFDAIGLSETDKILWFLQN